MANAMYLLLLLLDHDWQLLYGKEEVIGKWRSITVFSKPITVLSDFNIGQYAYCTDFGSVMTRFISLEHPTIFVVGKYQATNSNYFKTANTVMPFKYRNGGHFSWQWLGNNGLSSYP
ncbi:hypothetical protein FISHEDRAFT_54978 [Fistulina hepatica ATCC 64428]|uniref:Uncharacterized protein n=1 Tax=Fistulina hepatica ATCC 64428 TaxID=1128425 RepID=A0A0D7APR4_9AGAR|nr:hypothetical protein FISHEDRAFT_54978 [Fistulina hepatica ATCC 64428]